MSVYPPNPSKALLREHVASSVLQEVYGGTRIREYPIPPNQDVDEVDEPLTSRPPPSRRPQTSNTHTPQQLELSDSLENNSSKSTAAASLQQKPPRKEALVKPKRIRNPVQTTRMLLVSFLAFALAWILAADVPQVKLASRSLPL
jgi:hypothetical protein